VDKVAPSLLTYHLSYLPISALRWTVRASARSGGERRNRRLRLRRSGPCVPAAISAGASVYDGISNPLPPAPPASSFPSPLFFHPRRSCGVQACGRRREESSKQPEEFRPRANEADRAVATWGKGSAYLPGRYRQPAPHARKRDGFPAARNGDDSTAGIRRVPVQRLPYCAVLSGQPSAGDGHS